MKRWLMERERERQQLLDVSGDGTASSDLSMEAIMAHMTDPSLLEEAEMARSEVRQHAVVVLVVTPKGVPLVRDPKKPAPAYWKLPGGKGEKGETPLETAVRETKEEPGVTLTPEQLDERGKMDKKDHDLYFYRADLAETPEINSFGNEGEEVRLFTPDEMRTMPDLLPAHRPLIMSQFPRTGPSLRVH